MYLATVDGIYKSTNEGLSWNKKSSGIETGEGAKYEFAQSIFEFNDLLITGTFSGIYYSTDGGDQWLPTNITGSHVNAKSFTEHNGLIFAARESINEPNGYFSEVNGFTWKEMTNIHPTITFFSEELKLWAGTIHGIRLSTDNGETWEIKNEGLNSDPYNTSIIRIDGELFTSLKFGAAEIYRSSNEGKRWALFNEGLISRLAINKLILFYGHIYAVTSEGLWRYLLTTNITSPNDEILTKFELNQNYPNPFNPKTTIGFTIPNAETWHASSLQVSLEIYDILGRKVETIVNHKFGQGSYEIEFDGTNIPSGVYFYQLNSGEYSTSRKMILQK